jgi:hypothetical protein
MTLDEMIAKLAAYIEDGHWHAASIQARVISEECAKHDTGQVESEPYVREW